MLLVASLWGACFVAIRFGLPYITPLWFATLRASVAAITLFSVAVVLRRPLLPRAAWRATALLGLANVTVTFGAMFAGAVAAPAGVAAMLANAQPQLIILPAWILFRERPQPVQLVGVGIGFAGLLLATAPLVPGSGALLALGSAVAITTGTLLARHLSTLDPLTLTAWQFVAGSLGLLPWAAAVEGPPRVDWTPTFVVALGFLAVLGSAGAYLLWFAELGRSQLTALSGWTMLTPAFGILAGSVVLNDQLTTRQGLRILLALLAMPLVNLGPPRSIRDRARTHDRAAQSSGFKRSESSAECPFVQQEGAVASAGERWWRR